MRQIKLGILGVLAAQCLVANPASAQDNYQANYPSRVVRMVVPFPPGYPAPTCSRRSHHGPACAQMERLRGH